MYVWCSSNQSLFAPRQSPHSTPGSFCAERQTPDPQSRPAASQASEAAADAHMAEVPDTQVDATFAEADMQALAEQGYTDHELHAPLDHIEDELRAGVCTPACARAATAASQRGSSNCL